MEKTISQERFTTEFFAIFEEIFETHHGIFLDKGTSLFHTLAGITAEEASRPVGGKCATLAAQVTHVRFYLQVLERYIRKDLSGRVDWGEIWRTVDAVTPAEWSVLQGDLKDVYQQVASLLHGIENWDDENALGGAMAILVHTTYHLGEIRQALCTLK